ncbi:MAG: lysophospholipid acyltransferase family protein [Caulobacter sp.]|nr:lysophospholipid acyltransferase family protein [Caulobacter sp.]
MKALFRSPAVQQLLAAIFAGWLKLCFATLSWTREGQDRAEGVWAAWRAGCEAGDGSPAAGGGAILCLWHGRIPLSAVSWPQGPERHDMRALISRSADGEFIALAMQAIGFPAIRGSSKKASDPSKNKHGEQAFRDMIRWVREGGGMAITPDGPRGPHEVMQAGTPALARVTGAPVLLVGLACRPAIRLGSWDRAMIPLPFGRAAMVWDGPFTASRSDDVEALAADWGSRLSVVTRRAEAMLADPPAAS